MKKAGTKLKNGTYYKFIVVALNKSNKVVSVSKIAHVATNGNVSAGNPTKVKVAKQKTLKKGKTYKLSAKLTGKNIKKHRALIYETSNSKIATVTRKGVIKAKGKGTCYIYAYAQNGVFGKVKIKVN